MPPLLLVLAGCAHLGGRPSWPDPNPTAVAMRRLDGRALRNFIETNTGKKFEVWPPDKWTLEDLLWTGFFFHPSLDYARKQCDVAKLGGPPWFAGFAFDPQNSTSQRAFKSDELRRNIFVDACGMHKEVLRVYLEMYFLDQRRKAFPVSATKPAPRDASSLADDFSYARHAGATGAMAMARAQLAEALGVPEKTCANVWPDLSDAPALLDASPEWVTAARRHCLQTNPDLPFMIRQCDASWQELQTKITALGLKTQIGPLAEWDEQSNKWRFASMPALPPDQKNGEIAGLITMVRSMSRECAYRQDERLRGIDAALGNHGSGAAMIRSTMKTYDGYRVIERRLAAGEPADYVDRADANTVREDERTLFYVIEGNLETLVHFECALSAMLWLPLEKFSRLIPAASSP